MDDELNEMMEMMKEMLTQGAASVIGLMKMFSENEHLSGYMASIAKNHYDSYIEVGFTEDQAMELTVQSLKGFTGSK